MVYFKNVLGFLGGKGCGRGLLLLNLILWVGELGMGFRRVGCLLFMLLDFRVLRLGIFINLFVVDLLFFFFCCVKNNICT